MKFASFALLSTLFATALAVEDAPSTDATSAEVMVVNNAPAAPSAEATLSKRQAPETLILSNCDPASNFGSYIFYYKSGHDANGSPDDQCQVQSRSFVTWEGRHIECKFPSGVVAKIDISRSAQSFPDFSDAGIANNGFRGFSCRKDNKRTHWSASEFNCKSIYYCQ